LSSSSSSITLHIREPQAQAHSSYSFFVIIILPVSDVVLIFLILDGRSTEDFKLSSSSSSITLHIREPQAQAHSSSTIYVGCFGFLLSSKKQAEILGRRKVSYRFTWRSLCSKRQAKFLVQVLIKRILCPIKFE
jgi:hypothetical protein